MKLKPLLLVALVVVAAGALLRWSTSGGDAEERALAETQAASSPADLRPAGPEIESRNPLAESEGDRRIVPEVEPDRARRTRSAKTAKPEAAVSIRGKVIDDQGTPVRSFEITWERAGQPKRSEWSTTPLKGVRFENEDGSFQIRALQNRQWILRARDSATISIPTVVEVPQSDDPLVIVLPRPAVVRGLVLAPDGSPVWNARVYSWTPGEQEPRLHLGNDSEAAAQSDATGRFQLDRSQPGEVRLLASRDGLCDSEWTTVMTAPALACEIVLRMRHGGRVIGTIDASMGSVVGRELKLYGFQGSTGWRETHSDSKGSFAFENVAPQRYIIELREEEKPPDPSSSITVSPPAQVRRPIAVQEEGTTEVKFGRPDRSGIRVLGRVTCDGVPLAGLQVEAQSKELTEDADHRVTTDPNGMFELHVSGPRLYRFWIRDGDSFAVVQRDVADRDPCELTFELQGGSVKGVLRSPSGKPISRTGVTLLRDTQPGEDERESFFDRYRRTQTDSGGSFEFRLLQSGIYSLRAPDGFRGDSPPKRTAFGRVMLKNIRIGAGALDPQVLQLVGEGFIRGRVVGPSGSAVGGARVRVFDFEGCGLSATWDVSTDATGAFEVDSLATGSYMIGARKQETYGPRVPAEVVEGKTTQVTLEIP